jgi:DNA-binding PadR family transcriptional regulator
MVLLGLLYGGPGHGYDLHRQVAADLGQVWHLSQSQAYGILKRLQARGEVSVEEIPQRKLPPRHLLRLTPAGRMRFLQWLEAPSGGSTRLIRMEFITRLYFLRRYMPEKLREAFDQQRAESKGHIERLMETRPQLTEGQIYDRMSLDMRLRQLRMTLEWLDECEALIQPEQTPRKERL